MQAVFGKIREWLRTSSMGLLLCWVPLFLFFAAWAWPPLVATFTGKQIQLIFNRYYEKYFDRIQAGTAMDQPTVGKYFIFFIFFSVVASIYSAKMRKVSLARPKGNYAAFAIPFLVIVVWAYSFWTFPVMVLFHYIYQMGPTGIRVMGAIFSVASAVFWLVFAIAMLRRPKNDAASGHE